MKKAIAIVAHHDDHVLWMGGTIQRLRSVGWQWLIIAMCVPDASRRCYFNRSCSAWGVDALSMEFQDYQDGQAFSKNDRTDMYTSLRTKLRDKKFDLMFTHSRSETGEYWSRHANHMEVRELATELADSPILPSRRRSLAFFAYDVIYGSGTASCAKMDANYHLQLTYPELSSKCEWASLAPDAQSSLKHLAYPCPNPEGFEGDKLELPNEFVRREC